METGSSGGGRGGPGDDAHGLKFGKKIYFEQDVAGGSGNSSGGGGRRGKGPAASAGPAQGGGAAAAGGTAGSQQQQPRCQVEGCGVDLSDAKTYYCRHKVCSMHSKAPLVVVAGIEQRFCQQWSRYLTKETPLLSSLPLVLHAWSIRAPAIGSSCAAAPPFLWIPLFMFMCFASVYCCTRDTPHSSMPA